MARYAVVSGNIVENIIVSDNKEDAEKALGVKLVEFDINNPAAVGWTWNGTTFDPPVEQIV